MPALPSAPRRLKLLLEYSGTRYHGWQVQPNAVTIQGTLEACLARLTNGPVRLHAAGRTDAGVHALGQVVHFDTASTLALPALVRGANSLLPSDIVVRQAEDVADGFSCPLLCPTARPMPTLSTITLIPSALRAPYAWHVPQPLALPAMRAAARVLLGRHDFSAFRAACLHGAPPMALSLLPADRPTRRAPRSLCCSADGFLRHMARNDCRHARGHWPGAAPADAMATILQSGQAAGTLALQPQRTACSWCALSMTPGDSKSLASGASITASATCGRATLTAELVLAFLFRSLHDCRKIQHISQACHRPRGRPGAEFLLRHVVVLRRGEPHGRALAASRTAAARVATRHDGGSSHARFARTVRRGPGTEADAVADARSKADHQLL